MFRTLVFATALGALICLTACKQKPLPEDNVTADSMPRTQDISETNKPADVAGQGRADAAAPYPSAQAPAQSPPTLPEDKGADPNAATKPQPQ